MDIRDDAQPDEPQQLWLLCFGAPSKDELKVVDQERLVSGYSVRPVVGLSPVWIERIVGFVMDRPPVVRRDEAFHCLATLTANWGGSNLSEWTSLPGDVSALAPPVKTFKG